MAANEKKKQKHKCPPIDASWSAKITGPSYTPGMTPAEARTAWYSWLRVLKSQVRPMPRKTS